MGKKFSIGFLFFLIAELLYCSGELGFDSPIVFTVYNEQKTRNEAEDICHADNQTMLSISNDTIWQMWIAMFDPTITVPHRTSSRFWFGLHSNHPSNFSAGLYWDDCTIPDWLEWDQYRPAYDPDHPCLAFDVYLQVFTTVILKLWLALPCTDKLRFVCVWESSCIYQTCEEYLISLSASECTTACTTLSTIGEVTNLAGCRSRVFALDNWTVCHVYQVPGSFTPGNSFSICYKTSVDVPLKRCVTTPEPLDLSNFTDTSLVPSSTCPPHQVNPTTQATTLESLFMSTTSSAGLCECPCSDIDDTTNVPMTIEERVEILKKTLEIDKKQTSNNKRKYISVRDDRPSAKGLGAFGLGILILVPVCIVLMDLTSLSRHADYFCRRKIPGADIKRPQFPNVDREEYSSTNKHLAVNRPKTVSTFTRGFTSATIRSDAFNKFDSQKTIAEMTDQSSGGISMEHNRPLSVLNVRPQTSGSSKVQVVFKDILDQKYQSSMLASRVVANEIKLGKRQVNEKNVKIKCQDIEESRSNKNKVSDMSWINLI